MEKTKFMQEYELYDGEAFITFNVWEINEDKNEISVVVTNRGKITMVTYSLLEDNKGLYFEYGPDYTKIYINDFKEVI